MFARSLLVEDITIERASEDHLRHLAADSLTGLANYRTLSETLESEIKRSDRTGRAFAVLILDLNGMKQINESHGRLEGDRALCRLAEIFHFSYASTFAEEAVVPESCTIKIRDDVPLGRACFVGCGTMTGIGAAINTAKVRPGASVAVIGCGGVGLNVVQGAALAGARDIIAIDLLPNKLELAKVFGATQFVNPSQDDAYKAVMDLTRGRGADYAFEVISTPKTIEMAFRMTARGGTCVIVGVSPEGARISLNPNVFTLMEKRLIGSYYGSTRPRIDMPLLIDLYMDKKIKIDELVSRTFPLEGVNEAYDLLRKGEVSRSVIKFF